MPKRSGIVLRIALSQAPRNDRHKSVIAIPTVREKQSLAEMAAINTIELLRHYVTCGIPKDRDISRCVGAMKTVLPCGFYIVRPAGAYSIYLSF